MIDISLEQARDDKSNQIIEASKNLDIVLEEKFRLEKALLEVKEFCRKGKFNLSRLREEKEGLERAFWRHRESR